MIAAPIEQQINGVEGMARIESESRGDGSYVAYVRFRSGADPNLAMVQVQNRVALAQPILPAAVQKAGVTVKVAAAESGEKRRAAIALVDRDNHSREILRDASAAVLKRLSAERSMAAPQAFPGPDGKQLRIQINRAKCAEYGIAVGDIEQAAQSASGDTNIETLKTRPVTSTKGDAITLGMVATIELVDGPSGVYRVDLYPAVRIAGSPPEGKTAESAASQSAELADKELKSQNNPSGITVMNLTAP
jgi:multidrug efflux pump subunit AcrB